MMNTTEINTLWKAYDNKLNAVLDINTELIIELTKQKLNKQIGSLFRPKIFHLILAIPYIMLLVAITCFASLNQAVFVAVGFGSIALINIILSIAYFYHIHLIHSIQKSDDVLFAQQQVAKLKISSYNCFRLAVSQLPFWSICWVSINALKAAPLRYGGINLMIFLVFCFIAYKLYTALSAANTNSKLRKFLLTDREFEAIDKANDLISQIKSYKFDG